MFVLSTARKLHRKVGFDVVHHLNYVTIEMPGVLWSLGAPFVWGPVGGGQVPPEALKQYYKGFWGVEMIRAARKRFLMVNPFARMAAKKASYILVSNPDTARLLINRTDAPIVPEVEIGAVLPDVWANREVGSGRLEIVWAGLMIPRKGPCWRWTWRRRSRHAASTSACAWPAAVPGRTWCDSACKRWTSQTL